MSLPTLLLKNSPFNNYVGTTEVAIVKESEVAAPALSIIIASVSLVITGLLIITVIWYSRKVRYDSNTNMGIIILSLSIKGVEFSVINPFLQICPPAYKQ